MTPSMTTLTTAPPILTQIDLIAPLLTTERGRSAKNITTYDSKNNTQILIYANGKSIYGLDFSIKRPKFIELLHNLPHPVTCLKCKPKNNEADGSMSCYLIVGMCSGQVHLYSLSHATDFKLNKIGEYQLLAGRVNDLELYFTKKPLNTLLLIAVGVASGVSAPVINGLYVNPSDNQSIRSIDTMMNHAREAISVTINDSDGIIASGAIDGSILIHRIIDCGEETKWPVIEFVKSYQVVEGRAVNDILFDPTNKKLYLASGAHVYSTAFEYRKEELILDPQLHEEKQTKNATVGSQKEKDIKSSITCLIMYEKDLIVGRIGQGIVAMPIKDIFVFENGSIDLGSTLLEGHQAPITDLVQMPYKELLTMASLDLDGVLIDYKGKRWQVLGGRLVDVVNDKLRIVAKDQMLELDTESFAKVLRQDSKLQNAIAMHQGLILVEGKQTELLESNDLSLVTLPECVIKSNICQFDLVKDKNSSYLIITDDKSKVSILKKVEDSSIYDLISLFEHFPGKPTCINSIILDEFSMRIAIGDDSRRVKVYQVLKRDDGSEKPTIVKSFSYHAAKVTRLLWLDKHYLVSAALDDQVMIYQVDVSDEPIASLKFTSTITGLISHSHQKDTNTSLFMFATSHADGTIRVHQVMSALEKKQ